MLSSFTAEACSLSDEWNLHSRTGIAAPHCPRVSCTAAGRFVSSLHQGAAHAGRCVRLVVLRAVGFSIHGGSVAGGISLINAEISAIQGVRP